jgi:hypothetical protein
LLDGVVYVAHGLAGADEVLKAAVHEGLAAHVLASGFFVAGAEETDEGEAQFGDVYGAAKVSVGAGFEGLFFDGAGARAAERDESEIVVELTEFVEDGKAAVGVLVVGVDVEQDGDDVGLACPAGEVVIVFAEDDLKPGHQFRKEVCYELLVSSDDADDWEIEVR